MPIMGVGDGLAGGRPGVLVGAWVRATLVRTACLWAARAVAYASRVATMRVLSLTMGVWVRWAGWVVVASGVGRSNSSVGCFEVEEVEADSFPPELSSSARAACTVCATGNVAGSDPSLEVPAINIIKLRATRRISSTEDALGSSRGS